MNPRQDCIDFSLLPTTRNNKRKKVNMRSISENKKRVRMMMIVLNSIQRFSLLLNSSNGEYFQSQDGGQGKINAFKRLL